MSTVKYKLRTNVLIIAINDLLSKNLISLEYDPKIVYNGEIITEHEGICLCTEYRDIGWGEILIKVKGKFNEDVNNEIPDVYFFMKGYLERQTKQESILWIPNVDVMIITLKPNQKSPLTS